MSPLDAPSDLRLEAALGRWLHDEAPDAAPPDLMQRVMTRSTVGTQRWGRRHRAWSWRRVELLSAGAAAVVVVAAGSFLVALPAMAPAAPSPRPLSASCVGTESPASTGSRVRTVGRLHVGRTGHTATSLGDCRVLIVGGGDPDTEATASVELWDPTQTSLTELAPA